MAGLREKLQRMWNPPDDEYDYDENYYEEEEEEDVPAGNYEEPRRSGVDYGFDTFTSRSSWSTGRGGSTNLVDIRSTQKSRPQVVVFQPVSFGEEAKEIADELLRRHTVLLNLEKTEKDVARRIVDFLSGVAYANNGKIQKVATRTFIVTPYDVEISGDEVLDELESSGLYF
ncbi:cell division protein SepF [bacterium D16-76]|nr:cell division protein SepF [bacterium D16-76]